MPDRKFIITIRAETSLDADDIQEAVVGAGQRLITSSIGHSDVDVELVEVTGPNKVLTTGETPSDLPSTGGGLMPPQRKVFYRPSPARHEAFPDRFEELDLALSEWSWGKSIVEFARANNKPGEYLVVKGSVAYLYRVEAEQPAPPPMRIRRV
jgi:hypothetical protein